MSGTFTPVLELGPSAFGVSFLATAHGPGMLNVLRYTRLHEALVGDDTWGVVREEVVRTMRLNHPNVEQAFEFGVQGGERFFVTEFIDGLSLETLFARGGPAIATELYLLVLCDALAGLHHAHEARDDDGKPLGVVHGALGADKLIVDCSGGAKLVDFGAARMTAVLGDVGPFEERHAARGLGPRAGEVRVPPRPAQRRPFRHGRSALSRLRRA